MRTTAVRRSAAREPGSPRTVGSPVPGAAMLVIGGGICGLAWAAGLRGFMAQITVESNVSWSGTFGYVLSAGPGDRMLLGCRYMSEGPALAAAGVGWLSHRCCSRPSCSATAPLQVLGIFEDGI